MTPQHFLSKLDQLAKQFQKHFSSVEDYQFINEKDVFKTLEGFDDINQLSLAAILKRNDLIKLFLDVISFEDDDHNINQVMPAFAISCLLADIPSIKQFQAAQINIDRPGGLQLSHEVAVDYDSVLEIACLVGHVAVWDHFKEQIINYPNQVYKALLSALFMEQFELAELICQETKVGKFTAIEEFKHHFEHLPLKSLQFLVERQLLNIKECSLKYFLKFYHYFSAKEITEKLGYLISQDVKIEYKPQQRIYILNCILNLAKDEQSSQLAIVCFQHLAAANQCHLADNINQQYEERTLIERTATRGLLEVLHYFFENFAESIERDKHQLALSNAKDPKVAAFLIQKGIGNFNADLVTHCKKGNSPIVAEFIKQGINPTLPDATNRLPIVVAAEKGHVGTVKLLLPKVGDDQKAQALDEACKNGHTKVCRTLIAANVLFVNDSELKQNTLLHLACMNGKVATAHYLLTINEIAKQINWQNSSGETALHCLMKQAANDNVASNRKITELVDTLINEGASIEIINDAQEACYQLAARNNIPCFNVMLVRGLFFADDEMCHQTAKNIESDSSRQVFHDLQSLLKILSLIDCTYSENHIKTLDKLIDVLPNDLSICERFLDNCKNAHITKQIKMFHLVSKTQLFFLTQEMMKKLFSLKQSTKFIYINNPAFTGEAAKRNDKKDIESYSKLIELCYTLFLTSHQRLIKTCDWLLADEEPTDNTLKAYYELCLQQPFWYLSSNPKQFVIDLIEGEKPEQKNSLLESIKKDLQQSKDCLPQNQFQQYPQLVKDLDALKDKLRAYSFSINSTQQHNKQTENESQQSGYSRTP